MIHSLYHRDDAARCEEDLCFAKQVEVPADTSACIRRAETPGRPVNCEEQHLRCAGTRRKGAGGPHEGEAEMYYQFDSRLNMPAILFDDDRLVVGKNEYDYNDLAQIRIAKAPLLATYGIVELKTKEDRTIPVPFFKGDLHRLRVAVQELSHLLEVRNAEAARTVTAGQTGMEGGTADTRNAAGADIPTGTAVGDKECPVSDQGSSTGGSRKSVEEATRSNTLDPYEEMKKLKELLDLDIITREEFDRKKKDLLGL